MAESTDTQLETLVEGIAFGEGPRWHDGTLIFSDIADHRVKRVDSSGNLDTLFDLGERRPSGLGWLPDGRMLVVSMEDHTLMRQDGDRLEPWVDLSKWCGGLANDMVVDAQGRAYVGNLGFDLEAQKMEIAPTHIVRVDPDGSARAVASEVLCPNGMVITPDGRTLIAAESAGARLAAFEIHSDGSLGEHRVFAALPKKATPDGICLDAENCVWVASPTTQEFLRVREGGEIAQRISSGERTAIACMLGGDDRRTLFAITCKTTQFSKAAQVRDGAIATTRVEVPGAGRP
ncbi:SMP-30/gluconolactonase/LRE family protein [Myxococcota bacterium]|nr:SMP-30/gluconolactonase/LRE family protein [Myxococcota bacterium]